MNEAKKKAYRIAHNKLNMNTGFDSTNLLLEIDSIIINKLNIEATGFSLKDIEMLRKPQITEKKETIGYFKKAHILISYEPDLQVKVQSIIDKLYQVKGVSIEVSSN